MISQNQEGLVAIIEHEVTLSFLLPAHAHLQKAW
jgi:hypothetical protein